jgi:tRNA dimethylallyltransferase
VLHARLVEGDPITARRLPPGDRRRIIRALEVLALTGRPLSSFQTGHDRPAEGVRVFALERPRPSFATASTAASGRWSRDGLLDEVRRLRSGPRPMHEVPTQGVGYREAREHLDGLLSLDEMIARTRARTRQFAKRQGTWFRGLAECRAVPVGPDETAEAVADRLPARRRPRLGFRDRRGCAI